MTKGDYAKQLFESGMNCAQAVFCAFSDELGFDKDTALRISAGFGGGIGRLREVCGAVSGMTMTLSYKFACTDPNDRQRKAALYALIQRAETYYKKRPCGELVRLAADITEKYIKNGGEI